MVMVIEANSPQLRLCVRLLHLQPTQSMKVNTAFMFKTEYIT